MIAHVIGFVHPILSRAIIQICNCPFGGTSTSSSSTLGFLIILVHPVFHVFPPVVTLQIGHLVPDSSNPLRSFLSCLLFPCLSLLLGASSHCPVKLVTRPEKLFEHAVLLMTSLQLSYDDIALLSVKVFIKRSMHPGLNCSSTLLRSVIKLCKL